MRGEATVHIEAPPERVWSIVSDVTRMGQISPETYEAAWIGGATGPAVGARFRGRNRRGRMKWSTKCTVVAVEPCKEFTFVVGTRERPDTCWTYRIEPAGRGTDVTESWESIRYGFFTRLLQRPEKAEAALNEGTLRTLANLKATAEGTG